MSWQATTSQTVGPFFSIGLNWQNVDTLAAPSVSGERVEISGRMLDGDGQPVPDGIIELWQANAHGKYAHPEDTQDQPLEKGFTGYGRIPTDGQGRFRFTTIKPGQVPGPDKPGGKKTQQAPHIVVSVFARGLLRRLVTRIYFPDGPANATDFALNLVEPLRRATLIAKPVDGRPGSLEWNAILQGLNETVFFDV
jgi:protocatechuate 3,4-dioxygenase, alpha subunit